MKALRRVEASIVVVTLCAVDGVHIERRPLEVLIARHDDDTCSPLVPFPIDPGRYSRN